MNAFNTMASGRPGARALFDAAFSFDVLTQVQQAFQPFLYEQYNKADGKRGISKRTGIRLSNSRPCLCEAPEIEPDLFADIIKLLPDTNDQ